MNDESPELEGFRNTDTAEVRIRAGLAEELAEPAVPNTARPVALENPPSRDSFRRSRQSRRWRRRAGAGFMLTGVTLMVLGSIFFLSEQTAEPLDPVGVQGVTTVRDTSVPSSDPNAPFAVERTDPTVTIDPAAAIDDTPLPTEPVVTAPAPTAPPKPSTTVRRSARKPAVTTTTPPPVKVL